MADEPVHYVKLRGAGASLVERVSLYLGPDHLLQVSSTGYSESYLRFYFRDIQAITVRRTVRGAVLSIVYSVLAMLFLALAVDSRGNQAIWIFVTGVFIVLFILNFLAGATCACEIQTAVQKRRLGAVTRLPRARRFIERMRGLIQPEQGALPREEIVRRIDQIRQAGFYTDAPAVSIPRDEPPSAPTQSDPGGFR